MRLKARMRRGVPEWLKAHRPPLAAVLDGKVCVRLKARMRRGGRVAEGARLESVYAGNRIAGSNPAPSASSPSQTCSHRT